MAEQQFIRQEATSLEDGTRFDLQKSNLPRRTAEMDVRDARKDAELYSESGRKAIAAAEQVFTNEDSRIAHEDGYVDTGIFKLEMLANGQAEYTPEYALGIGETLDWIRDAAILESKQRER